MSHAHTLPLVVALLAPAAAANDPPISVADTYSTPQGKNLSVDAPGVLANDVDSDPLTAILVSSSQATGVLKLYSDGSFEYEVADGFFGTDVFTYKANDGVQDGNVTTITFDVTLGTGANIFTSESLFLSALSAHGFCSVTEGFESDAEWGLARSTIVDGQFTLDSVVSRGVTWSSNSAVNGITTSSGAAQAGAWGGYSLPHGDYAHGIGDGIRGTPLSRVVAVGGWVRTNTPPAEIGLFIDGAAASLDFGDASALTSGPAKFFGYIDPAGFQSFEYRELEGKAEDQKLVFFDRFTLGYDLTDDCNGNAIPDACDIAAGTSTDCDVDGVPDSCGPDCDANLVPDACDVLTSVHVDSGALAPISFASPQSFTVPSARPAATKVGLQFWTVAQLGSFGQRFDVDVNGVPVGSVFGDSYASSCPTFAPDYDQLVLDASVFNSTLTGGSAVVHVKPTSNVGTSCSNSYVRVVVSYTGVAAADGDGNGVPDVCEAVCQTDLGFGGPGSSTLSACGGDLSSGTTATLLVAGAPPLVPALLLAGTQQNPTPFGGGLLVPLPAVFQITLVTDGNGEITIPGIPGGNGPATIYAQCAMIDPSTPSGYGLSNALRLDFLP